MDQTTFWWDGWQPLARTVVVGTPAYVWLVFLLRITGPHGTARRRRSGDPPSRLDARGDRISGK